ncbi:MAG TPA: hypothetical protein VGG36_04490 [Rhizomicrobium sp.]|jgi:hypothetical protein
MRIFVAGLLGAIAMFIWTSIAHVATPLATAGFKQIPNEAPVLSAMQSSIGDHAGLYIYPWVDPKDPNAMGKSMALMKTNPSGIMIYHPANSRNGSMGPLLAAEFVKEFIQALIAAWIVSLVAVATYFGRVAVVTAIGVSGTLMTNFSYHVWYGFPANYMLAQFIVDIVGAFVAGLAIAWWLGRAIRTS